MENTARKGFSWATVIFWTILFFPVGFVLMLLRIFADSTAAVKNRKAIRGTAYVQLSIAAAYVGMCLRSPALVSYFIIMIIVFGVPGVWMLHATRHSKLHGDYKQYIDLIVKQKIESIDALVFTNGLPYERVIEDIEKLITTLCLVNIQIDKDRNVLVRKVPGEKKPSPKDTHPAAGDGPSVYCRACGANSNITAGEPAVCEYCGSPL